MFLHLHIHEFYARTAIKRLQSEQSVSSGDCPPLIVHRDKAVFDCVLPGQQVIRCGTPLGVARTLCPEAQCLVYRASEFSAAHTLWLDSLLVYCDSIECHDQHAASMDLSNHPDPMDISAQIVENLFTQHGWKAQSAIAPIKWVAQLATKIPRAETNSDGSFPPQSISNCKQYLAELPTELLLPVSSEVRERLCFLGYRRIGDVQRASEGLLCRYFGTYGRKVFSASHGLLYESLRKDYPRRSIQAAMEFLPPIESAITLRSAINHLVDKLAIQLSSQEKQADEVWLSIQGEERTMILKRCSARPLRSTMALRACALPLIDQILSSARDRVVSVRVILPNLKHAERRQEQFHVLLDVKSKKEQMEKTIGTLAASLGDAIVQPASAIELPRRKKVLRVWREATGWH